eukprot:TRINITY_DN1106_c0_g2_i11.p1 TRINITY_DN1106_c0_g2~~TRINITY_DN1106_c0_g2_i11.p1  ORF type:complete len:554 (-),score=80.35 TRINITY_DN1106_c0_g2_i11:346-1944(-)
MAPSAAAITSTVLEERSRQRRPCVSLAGGEAEAKKQDVVMDKRAPDLTQGQLDALKPENGWRPFPWTGLPKAMPLMWGALILAFIGPFVVFLITAAEASWYILQKVWKHPRLSFLRKLPNLIHTSISEPCSVIMMKDPRNAAYLPWITFGACLPPALFLWAARRHHMYGFELSSLFLYHFLRIGPRFRFFAHLHTLFHKEGHDHRGFWQGPFQMFSGVCEWWIGPFYGLVPCSYSIAHNKIHHRWHNDVDDIHTNLDLDRTEFQTFVEFMPRFMLYWTGIGPVALFAKRREWGYMKQLLSGMAAFYGVALLLFLWNPVFCICYWLYPHMEACVGLGAIAYLWHAFVDEEDPGNQFVNSVTILDGHDNVFNEDYHVVHHHFPAVHWTEVPAQFAKDKDRYAECTATIFRDTEQGMLLKMLFSKDFDGMARHFVDLTGKLSHDEIKELLIRRLKADTWIFASFVELRTSPGFVCRELRGLEWLDGQTHAFPKEHAQVRQSQRLRLYNAGGAGKCSRSGQLVDRAVFEDTQSPSL